MRIERLIELLNEYEEEGVVYTEGEEGEITPTWRREDGHIWHCNAKTVMFENSTFDRYVCSKSYGFIKWLVENDKIKRDEEYGTIEFYCDEYSHYACRKDLDIFEGYESLLMYLSISDNPIQDLVNMLK